MRSVVSTLDSTRVINTSLTTNTHSISAKGMQLFPSTHQGFCVFTGYGFVDFDSPAAAQKAVASLKANGVQAQMAKVRMVFRFWFCFLFICDHMFLHCLELNHYWSLLQVGLCLLVKENLKPHYRLGLEESGQFISLILCVYLLMSSFIVTSLVM